jgi:RecJ-like exonuclease
MQEVDVEYHHNKFDFPRVSVIRGIRRLQRNAEHNPVVTIYREGM